MDNAFVTQARADPDRVEVRNPQGRWLALVRRFRRGLSAAGVATGRGLFPVQTIQPSQGMSAPALHRRLAKRGVRAVLHRGENGSPPRVSFLLTSRHTSAEVATAVSAIAAVSPQPVTSKEIHHEEPIYH